MILSSHLVIRMSVRHIALILISHKVHQCFSQVAYRAHSYKMCGIKGPSTCTSGIQPCNEITRTLQQFSNLNKYTFVAEWYSGHYVYLLVYGSYFAGSLFHCLNGRQRPAILHLSLCECHEI